MIYEPEISVDATGVLRVFRPQRFSDYVFRTLSGVFLGGVGLLVLDAFLFGGGPRPTGGTGQFILSVLICALFILVLGVFPLLWGVREALLTQDIVLFPARRSLEFRTFVCGIVCWRRTHGFEHFSALSLHLKPASPKFSEKILVFFDDTLCAAFVNRQNAERFATRIAKVIGVPLKPLAREDK